MTRSVPSLIGVPSPIVAPMSVPVPNGEPPFGPAPVYSTPIDVNPSTL